MKAACADEPLATFFPDDELPIGLALSNARDFCDTCPVRWACLEQCCKVEGTESLDHRAGIFGGMTPQQRHSLAKRGQPLRCSDCGELFDPVPLRDGILECGCATRTNGAPIPDRGDQWTERHTKLARITIDWMADNVEVGGSMPDALKLSRTLKVGVKDLRRVYQALIEDHVLIKNKGLLRRRNGNFSTKQWTPRHLRDTVSSPSPKRTKRTR